VFFLYVTLGLPARGGHSSNKYRVLCDGLWVDFDAVFSDIFQIGLFFSYALHSSHFRC